MLMMQFWRYNVVQCCILVYKHGPRRSLSKGVGFIQLATEFEAQHAVECMTGYQVRLHIIWFHVYCTLCGVQLLREPTRSIHICMYNNFHEKACMPHIYVLFLWCPTFVVDAQTHVKKNETWVHPGMLTCPIWITYHQQIHQNKCIVLGTPSPITNQLTCVHRIAVEHVKWRLSCRIPTMEWAL